MNKNMIFILLLLVSPAFAQDAVLSWSVLSSGGGHFQGDTINIDATIGQPISGVMTGAGYELYAGFWIPGGCFYIPGNANGIEPFNGLDVVYSVNYLKGTGPAPPDTCDCVATSYPFYGAADANGNCVFNGIDIVYMVNYLKGNGPPPIACPDCPPGGILPKNASGRVDRTKDN
jgi:hypothetical protein